MIDSDLAEELFRSVGMRNVIVHQYIDQRPASYRLGHPPSPGL